MMQTFPIGRVGRTRDRRCGSLAPQFSRRQCHRSVDLGRRRLHHALEKEVKPCEEPYFAKPDLACEGIEFSASFGISCKISLDSPVGGAGRSTYRRPVLREPVLVAVGYYRRPPQTSDLPSGTFHRRRQGTNHSPEPSGLWLAKSGTGGK